MLRQKLALHFLNLLQLQTFLRLVRTILSHVINFQPFLTSFAPLARTSTKEVVAGLFLVPPRIGV